MHRGLECLSSGHEQRWQRSVCLVWPMSGDRTNQRLRAALLLTLLRPGSCFPPQAASSTVMEADKQLYIATVEQSCLELPWTWGVKEWAERAPQGPAWMTGSADLPIPESCKSMSSFLFCFVLISHSWCGFFFFLKKASFLEWKPNFRFQKCAATAAPLVVPLLTPLTANSISLNKRCSSGRPGTWSPPHGFPLCDSNVHIFTVISVNDCCVPHLARPYQYQFRTMKLPQSRGSGVTNRVKMGSVMPWRV